MPIYAYRCASCGFEQDVLQKVSEDPLTDCPTLAKQVTAAGFQLKGSGWYVTDFRDSGKKPAEGSTSVPSPKTEAPKAAGSDAAPAGEPAKPAASVSAAAPVASTPAAPAATPSTSGKPAAQ